MTTLPAPDHVLDCSGTLCPMPVVRLREEIEKIAVGQVIKVIATDPASVNDMPAFARNTGHELLETVKGPGFYEYYFRKTAEEDE
jgi:tRNA 2-thiouridine synthesizing protein A